MPNTLLTESLVVILAAAGAVGLVKRVGLPPILGYLLAGLAIGPHGIAVLAPSEGTAFLSELGVVLLMFMVGLEFSLPKMIAARATVFGAGACQVALTTLGVALAARLLGAGWLAAVVMGGVVAMSSTAIVLKQLSDEGELGSQHGRLAVGILLFQDLAALPFLVLVGTSGEDFSATTLSGQLLAAALAFVLIAVVGQRVFRAALAWAAQGRSPELFLLCSLALALGTAFAAQAAGLSAPIGAFLAGMAVGESDFRHQIEDDVRPFRDLLVGLFFVTIGMQIDPTVLAAAPLAVLGWIGVFLAGKAALATLAAVVLRWPVQVALRVGVILAHGGEFGLLLLTQAMSTGMIEPSAGQAMLVALALTMGLAPILIQRSAAIADLVGIAAMTDEEAAPQAGHALEDHVILCGCGRVGRLLALVLEAAKVPYIAIESDLSRFREAKRAGHHAVFGDASRAQTLHRVGVQRARLLTVTFDERRAVERLLHHARHNNAGIVAVVSAGEDRALATITETGANVVFPENLAAGLALADQILLLSGLSQEQAASIVTEIRAELNPELQGRVGV
ncbi:MAG: cation:proton antiporter [Geminicoccaceae bacterium]